MSTAELTRPRILIIGGGYVGLFTALRLRRRLRPSEAVITVVEPRSTMTYQPFLPEAAAGSLSPRHVVVPLRQVLRHCQVITARVVDLNHDLRQARLQPLVGPSYDLPYDQVIFALGSVARTLPIPGLAEQAVGFKTIEEAIYLRNQVLHQLDIAQSLVYLPGAEARRRRALTFTFVGGGFAGVEALAELEDMARDALRYYPELDGRELRFVLIEASGRILPEVGQQMGGYALGALASRGIEVRLNTRLQSCVNGEIVLSDGTRFESDTLVWTAGVRANPVLANYGIPLDRQGRIVCTPDLRVEDTPGAWAAGDAAAVPDLVTREAAARAEGAEEAELVALCGPSAQHAVRQARVLADNVLAALRGKELTVYRHRHAGSVASLGLYKGVARIYGIPIKGVAAWFLHRTYHLSRVPTWNRKLRVVADWTLALFFRREVISLGSMATPFEEFKAAADADNRMVLAQRSPGGN